MATSSASAGLSGASSGGTCDVSFPRTAAGIFLRAPEEENRVMGQCRSIAEQPLYCIITRGKGGDGEPMLRLADVWTLSSLRLLAHLLLSRRPAEYHPLKYLQSVTSVLRHSQAEQLFSGPESRLDQISRCFPQTGNCGICSPICPPPQ